VQSGEGAADGLVFLARTAFGGPLLECLGQRQRVCPDVGHPGAERDGRADLGAALPDQAESAHLGQELRSALRPRPELGKDRERLSLVDPGRMRRAVVEADESLACPLPPKVSRCCPLDLTADPATEEWMAGETAHVVHC
jgi:hypothetical protein